MSVNVSYRLERHKNNPWGPKYTLRRQINFNEEIKIWNFDTDEQVLDFLYILLETTETDDEEMNIKRLQIFVTEPSRYHGVWLVD